MGRCQNWMAETTHICVTQISVVSTVQFWQRHTIYMRERHKQSCGNIHTSKSVRTCEFPYRRACNATDVVIIFQKRGLKVIHWPKGCANWQWFLIVQIFSRVIFLEVRIVVILPKILHDCDLTAVTGPILTCLNNRGNRLAILPLNISDHKCPTLPIKSM